MIEVVGKLLGGSVYLPGENIVCRITFSNSEFVETQESQVHTDYRSNIETLAWASAQIHCLCSTNSKVSIPLKGNALTTNSTSLLPGDPHTSFAPYSSDIHGQIVFSTKPKILFCDLQLPSGLNKSYIYSEVLPNEAPPSYRGQLVKYSYKITIGTQRVNCPIKLLRIPLRVLAINGLPDYNICEDSEDLSPNNPFLERHDKEHELGPALQLMQNITSRRNPNFYNVTNTRGKVGRFCLFKQAYRLGEDIVGTFDFTKSTVPCIQLTVTLQCHEKIANDYRCMYKQEMATVSFSKYHEVCLNMKHCHLNLPIPLYATPAFATELVSLNWKLHFEFVTGNTNCSEVLLSGDKWQAPATLNIETMIWDLPIQIYPTIPTTEPNSRMVYHIVF